MMSSFVECSVQLQDNLATNSDLNCLAYSVVGECGRLLCKKRAIVLIYSIIKTYVSDLYFVMIACLKFMVFDIVFEELLAYQRNTTS